MASLVLAVGRIAPRTAVWLVVASVSTTTPAYAVAAEKKAAAARVSEPEPEPPITETGPGGDYLRMLHARVHTRWTDNFLHFAETKLPPQNPLNDRSRSVLIRLVLSPDGQIISTRVLRESGWLGFDDAAKEVLRDSGPLPPTPTSLRSDDGYVHIDWLFARDARRDALLTLRRFDQPTEVALPQLIQNGRREDAIRRLKAASAEGHALEPLMTRAAVEWLRASLLSPYGRVEAAAALADRKDPAGLRWLRQALRRPDLAQNAGAALAARDQRVCPLVKRNFDSMDVGMQTSAALALADAGEVDCREGLTSLLQSRAPMPSRAAALVALGAIADERARAHVVEGLASDDARLRAAAVAGLARGAARGRPALLARYFKDPSPDVRAAAAEGFVRAGGRLTAADIEVLVSDSDPRPARAAADALAASPDREATSALARLIERSEDAEALAKAARGIVVRGDPSSYGVLARLVDNANAPAEARAWALAAADQRTLDTLAKDPKLGPAVYRAELAQGERNRAAHWLLDHVTKLPPVTQDQLMLDWITARPSPPETPPVASARRSAVPVTSRPPEAAVPATAAAAAVPANASVDARAARAPER